MKVALDTNVLANAEGVNGTSMKNVALELVNRLPQASVVLPVQTLGELFQVLVRKAARTPEDARSAILSWRDAFALLETSAAAVLAATDLVVNHQLGGMQLFSVLPRRRIVAYSCLRICRMGLSGRESLSSIPLYAPGTVC